MKDAKPARVLVITGSGISAESGIPTFRGSGGYWRNHDPTKLATQSAFDRDPKLVWEWYRERRGLVRRATPNPAHRALVALQGWARQFLLVTQNVDDLDRRAGMPDQALVQIHGRIFDSRCESCAHETNDQDAEGLTPVPVCPRCGSRLRPGVVWFNEMLPVAEVARVESYLEEGPCDLVLVVGTTAVFDYIVDWATRARGAGGWLVEVNPEQTAITPHADRHIHQPAAQALPELLKKLQSGEEAP